MEQEAKKKVIETFLISDAYTVLINPLKDEIDSLKHAYEVEGKEAAELKGYYKGLNFIPDQIDMYLREGEITDVRRTPQEESPEENKII